MLMARVGFIERFDASSFLRSRATGLRSGALVEAVTTYGAMLTVAGVVSVLAEVDDSAA
jgi:hypothetical protein